MPELNSEPKTKTARDPQPLTPEYHKARKQLMLWAAVLFVWELVGIDLQKAKEAGGSTGALIAALKSPQAVPWVLLALTLYFVFKLRIEWGQCNQTRRKVVESRLDYYSALAVAGAALALYIIQTISRAQVANLVQEPTSRLSSLLAGTTLTTAVAWCGYFLWERFAIHTRKRNDLILIAAFGIALGALPMVSLLRFRPRQWSYLLLGAGIGAVIWTPALRYSAKKTRRYYSMPEQEVTPESVVNSPGDA